VPQSMNSAECAEKIKVLNNAYFPNDENLSEVWKQVAHKSWITAENLGRSKWEFHSTHALGLWGTTLCWKGQIKKGSGLDSLSAQAGDHTPCNTVKNLCWGHTTNFFCHRQLICHSVCLIERKHLQLLSRVLCVCVIISGDPLLGFVIFNVLLSGCCCCQQWRKATESLFTAFRTMIHISIVFCFFHCSLPVPVWHH